MSCPLRSSDEQAIFQVWAELWLSNKQNTQNLTRIDMLGFSLTARNLLRHSNVHESTIIHLIWFVWSLACILVGRVSNWTPMENSEFLCTCMYPSWDTGMYMCTCLYPSTTSWCSSSECTQAMLGGQEDICNLVQKKVTLNWSKTYSHFFMKNNKQLAE